MAQKVYKHNVGCYRPNTSTEKHEDFHLDYNAERKAFKVINVVRIIKGTMTKRSQRKKKNQIQRQKPDKENVLTQIINQ